MFPEVTFAKFSPTLWQGGWATLAAKILPELFIYSAIVRCGWLFFSRLFFTIQHYSKWWLLVVASEHNKRLYKHLSPALHSNGMQWPFLRWCPGLQWRQWSSAVHIMQSAEQGSHCLLAEWKNLSGQTSRHWPLKRYLATPNLSRWSKKRKGNLFFTCQSSCPSEHFPHKECWCTKQVCRHSQTRSHQNIDWFVSIHYIWTLHGNTFTANKTFLPQVWAVFGKPYGCFGTVYTELHFAQCIELHNMQNVEHAFAV